MFSSGLWNSIPVHTQEEVNPQVEGDYIDHDGLLRCGECGGRKQCRVNIGGDIRVVPCLCECAERRLEEQKRRMKAEETLAAIDRLKAGSMMDSKLKDATFDNYEIIPENKRVFDLARRYVEKFDELEQKNQGIVFCGSVGTGKSYTAACIANALLARAVPVVMTSFVKILQDFGDVNEGRYVETINRARLLIIDDLGAERDSSYGLEKIYGIIDSRVRANKPLILTTNIALNSMLKASDVRYQRIYDRVLEVCYPVEMNWKSFRRKEAAERFNEMKNVLEGA